MMWAPLRFMVSEGAIAMAILAAAVCAAPRAARAEEPRELRVLAAASLTEVVEALARRYRGARVVTAVGPSSELARQIVDGAPADVFVSASPAWIDFLRDAGALDGAPVLVARNALVCVAPERSAIARRGAGDPKALLDQLAEGDRVGIADAGVPAGDYARAALERLGLLASFTPHLVGQRDVRAVLHAVAQGELAAGFVYATDAAVAPVARLFDLDPALHPPVEYYAAVLRDAAEPAEARRFTAELQSEAARALLRAAGFSTP